MDDRPHRPHRLSNAWTIVAFPDDDIDGILREIVAGNDGIADQELCRNTLMDSFDRLRDFEAIGMTFPREADGSYARRPTRGLDLARVMHPDGGGLEFCWHLRGVLEKEGVELAGAESDPVLRELQQVMFAYDIGILKHADRLEAARDKVVALAGRAHELQAPHVHELVRLCETEAMLLAAQFILGAQLSRTESRLSHFREDHEQRDDEKWLVWVGIADKRATVQ